MNTHLRCYQKILQVFWISFPKEKKKLLLKENPKQKRKPFQYKRKGVNDVFLNNKETVSTRVKGFFNISLGNLFFIKR